jgi:hypothetical protein
MLRCLREDAAYQQQQHQNKKCILGSLLCCCSIQDNWQMKVKCGMHSLARHSELQLLYMDPGVVPEGPERDALKRVAAAERYK